MTCAGCGTPFRDEARFCGACGAPRPAEPAPPATAPSGPPTPLAALPEPLRLFVDVATLRLLAAGSRGLVRLAVENAGAVALAAVRVTGQLPADAAGKAATLVGEASGTVFPGARGEVALWFTPDLPGVSEISGVVETADLVGERARCAFGPFRFRVAAPGNGPVVHVVNVDQRSARVVDNSRASFAAGGGGSEGGLLEAADWHPVSVHVLPPPAVAAASAVPPAQASEGFVARTARGTYRLSRVIAEGDLATVYEGEWEGPDGAREPVAVKVPFESADNDLMQNETRALARLHADAGPMAKHLPTVLDRFRTPEGQLATVFPRFDGLDLAAIRERLPDGIPPVHILWLLRRTLSVLGLAHGKRVIHGNVDPAHILVRPRDHNVWIVDWCWAIFDPGPGSGFRCENEVYSPPEVAERKPPLPSSDIFSAGRCMIHALGGDPRTGWLPETVDERIARFLHWMTRESPLQRPQDAWALFRAVDSLREEVFGPHRFIEFEV